MEEKVAVLVQTMANRAMNIKARSDAAKELAEISDPEGWKALEQIANDESESEEMQKLAGEGLAVAYFREARVNDLPLNDFTGAAYLAFDKTVARLISEGQRGR